MIVIDLDLFGPGSIKKGCPAQKIKYPPLTLHEQCSFLRYAADMKGSKDPVFIVSVIGVYEVVHGRFRGQ